ncbi:hypothetical protein IR009_02940 [Pseudomonas putida]|uniref:hypothetical protein n=1 Tax=Pseudomonas putida TaxID=303 RepID=UPI0018AAA0A5|nr:hypothetical protein [Pseudomonas putida]MBF8764176.1 hypothetical protein [Pseudomonas putida]
MNEQQIERVQQLVKELADKSNTSFDNAFERAFGVMKYHAVDAVPWGKVGADGSSRVEES